MIVNNQQGLEEQSRDPGYWEYELRALLGQMDKYITPEEKQAVLSEVLNGTRRLAG